MGCGVVLTSTTDVRTGAVETGVSGVATVTGVVLMTDFGVASGSVVTAVVVAKGVSKIGITMIFK